MTYSMPVPYEPSGFDLAARLRRLLYLEQDAGRPGLSQPALDALFAERESLLGKDSGR